MDLKDFFGTKRFKTTTYVVGILFILILVFQAGVMVGYRKAGFSFRYGDNYFRNFGGHRDSKMFPPRGFGDRDFIQPSGASGKIINNDEQTITIKDRDNLEKIIIINEKTIVKNFRNDIKSSDLKTDDYIVIIGEPNETGQIVANLIRLMPIPFEPSKMLNKF